MTAAQLKAAILDLAIHGKLVPQDPNDELAGELVKQIAADKITMGCAGKTRSFTAKYSVEIEIVPFAVPDGWVWQSLGDIASKITDGEHKTPNRCPSFEGYYLLSARNVLDGSISLGDVDYVDEREYLRISKRCNPTIGDVLVSCSGSIGRCCCVNDDNKYVMVRSAAMLRPIRVYDKYVMYGIQSPVVQSQFRDKIKKSLQPNLFLGAIASTVLPIPPLAEQKRIVAKIDELMPLVERYAGAEERRIKLDESMPIALLKSALKSAFDGELTPDCDFEERVLDDVCAEVFTGNSLSDEEKKKFTRADGLPFVGTKDVGFDQVIDYENGIRIPVSESRYRTAPSGATLLCVEGGSSGRKIGLVDRDVRFGNKLCAFVPGSDLEAKYLFLYLQSPQFLDQFSELQNGPRKGAGVKQVKALTIPMTDKGTQKQIVQKVEQLLLQVRRVGVRASRV